MTRALVSAAFLSGTLALATRSSGQGTDEPPGPVPTADQLDQEAARLKDSVPEYARAVRLLEQSVALRRADDPRAAECLWWAAWFSYDRLDLPGARTFMEQAANRSLALGNIFAAADDELDAGLVAQEEGNAAEVERLGEKVLMLARSPALSAAERASILSRIAYREHTSPRWAVGRPAR
ncbi:MAG TPA: hypothetical protein VNW46_15685 [Gemmatimonadaceae bacterium]|nr:hypothetical protein [Gemmatimonadaceae bacterium]